MRKIFTFLFASLMSVGMWAETTVTWDSSTLSSIYLHDGESFTKDGVTVDVLFGEIDGYWMGYASYDSFKFSTSLGNFTRIEITGDIMGINGSGWTQTSPGAVWTGDANETTFGGYFEAVSQIVFTIEESEPAGGVTVVFAANDKTVERTVTLPHTFKCDWYNGIESQKELDIIIHELYSDYEYCNNNIQASGSDQVEVGTESNSDDYITIKGVFEGTATVTGGYLDVSYGEHNYSITISIKGDEPEPEPQPAVSDTITWDNDFCMDVEAYYDADEESVIEDNNTKDGITVTFVGNEIDEGLTGDVIQLYELSSVLTFTSTVGNIQKIEIYYTGNIASTPNGWTLDATNNKFVWEGTPAAAVNMVKGTGNVDFEIDHIVFIVESQGGTTAVENVQTNQVHTTKFFRNGMLFIEKNGKIYNVQGAEVR